MIEQKRYTAQEMRETLKSLYVNMIVGMRGLCCAVNSNDVISMLRQAADAEEENARLRVDADIYKGAAENWERKAKAAEARLEAVVKECEAIKSHYEKVVLSQLPITLVVEANRILRAARGEGGAE